jgi:hypothetical protein
MGVLIMKALFVVAGLLVLAVVVQAVFPGVNLVHILETDVRGLFTSHK